jgi:hypothetical protein
MATDTATQPTQYSYWRDWRKRQQDPDARDEAREMGYVARGRDDDAPEEGRE